MTRILGIVIILFGLVAVVFGGVRPAEPRADLDLAFVDFEVTERRTLPLPPAAGAAAIVAGVAIMFVAARRSAA
jgi:hypothetical protein